MILLRQEGEEGGEGPKRSVKLVRQVLRSTGDPKIPSPSRPIERRIPH
jgi:hypothetical protein